MKPFISLYFRDAAPDSTLTQKRGRPRPGHQVRGATSPSLYGAYASRRTKFPESPAPAAVAPSLPALTNRAIRAIMEYWVSGKCRRYSPKSAVLPKVSEGVRDRTRIAKRGAPEEKGRIMRAVLKTFCGGLAVSALIFTASAQEPMKLVRLNVAAVDAQGKPVGDLTANDFHIVDDGKPETIALFRAGGFGPVTAANPSEFSNRPSPPPHSTVVLFDCLNHMRAECVYAAKKLGTSLKQIDDAGSVYFYVLTPAGELNPIHPLPDSPGAAPNKTWNQDVEAMLAKEMKGLKPRPSGMSDEIVTKKTYVALENLGKQLANYPGRRDIIWVLGGVPYTWNDNTKNPLTAQFESSDFTFPISKYLLGCDRCCPCIWIRICNSGASRGQSPKATVEERALGFRQTKGKAERPDVF